MMCSDASYIYQRWSGHCLMMQHEERRMYEVARWQSVFIINGYAKKPVKSPTEIVKFPWEITPKKLKQNDVERLKKYGTK